MTKIETQSIIQSQSANFKKIYVRDLFENLYQLMQPSLENKPFPWNRGVLCFGMLAYYYGAEYPI